MQLEIIKDSINSQGYYYGNIFDLITVREKYEEYARFIRDDFWPQQYKLNWYSFINSVKGNFEPGEAYESMLRPEQIEQRLNLIKEKGFQTTQQWLWFGHTEIMDWFVKNVIEPIVFYLYPDLNIDNIGHEHRLTLYRPGDFAEIHLDSGNSNRQCAVLLYLSDEKDYNDGGGRLILKQENSMQESYVLPFIPNFSIMNLEKHKILHGVEPVRNDFLRFAYLDFVAKIK